jgi:hypothetical protein
VRRRSRRLNEDHEFATAHLGSTIWVKLDNLLQERVGVGQVVDTKIAKLLLEVTGRETSWREDSIPKEIQGSGQALIGSALLWRFNEI